MNAPPEPETVPVVVVPSPQSTFATKSPATFCVFVSVKVATVTLLSATLGSPWMVVPDALKDCSGADIEAALVRAKFRALSLGRGAVAAEDIAEVLKNFIPPSYPLEIELQNLAAVQECTSRDLLPETFRSLDRAFVTQRIREIKALLEER